MSEEIVIDLSNVPLKPIGKKEISQLEMALIVGTLYRPEVLELIRDPIERATWIDSLAVAAAAFARYKAGIPVSQIAEELGRSETTIRSHLNQKTKAGKLIAETYEKIRKSELKLALPFIKAPMASAEEEIRVLRSELEELRKRNKSLEEEIQVLKQEVENLRQQLSSKELEVEKLRKELESVNEEREEVSRKYTGLLEEIAKVKQLIQEVFSTLERITTVREKGASN